MERDGVKAQDQAVCPQKKIVAEDGKKRLEKLLYDYTKQNTGVAFSGGADSSLLLKMACHFAAVNGTRVTAFMMETELLPLGDVEVARKVAHEAGAELVLLTMDALKEAGIENNPENRCYLCKKAIFARILEEARKRKIDRLMEGTNADDLLVYRPGIRAIGELGIQSPLAEAGMTKTQVRLLAEAYGVSVADRPSSPCMATRFPYGTELSEDKLNQAKRGEEYLRGLGYCNVRLRVHGEIARIEVDKKDLGNLLAQSQQVISRLKNLGYRYITLDLEGFRSGSMDG